MCRGESNKQEEKKIMQGEIERDGWQAYLNNFSKRNAGRMVRVEIMSQELGAQEEVEMLQLEGVTFEARLPNPTTLRLALRYTDSLGELLRATSCLHSLLSAIAVFGLLLGVGYPPRIGPARCEPAYRRVAYPLPNPLRP